MKYTQEQIDILKEDLQNWFDDYVQDGGEGEWLEQLDDVFKAAYGDNKQTD
jgi:hypothetical protein